ncbi:MAG: substrate-binding domain-containing protein [Kiritimatiellae bacterium]|nr:substrate-binding domain-containing protein [Kiritimatiellia bacterium]
MKKLESEKIAEALKGELEAGRWKAGGKLLSAQLARCLKDAIRCGIFEPGAVLPGSIELSVVAKVGEKTARRALAELAKEGWTVPKRHVGSVVVERGLPTLFMKRILFFVQDPYYCYYIDQLVSCVRDCLLKGRGEVSIASACGCRGKRKYLQLEEFLKERWDLVIVVGNTSEAAGIATASGWPFIGIADGRKCRAITSDNCIGQVDIMTGNALGEFARACAKKGVRRVLQVLGLPNAYDATDMLKMLGVEVKTLEVENLGSPESMSKGGFAAIQEWFASKRGAWRPDVVFFTDDYVAQGGLIALNSLGLRIPEDVAVVSHANKGHGPVWEKPLTRLEMDPVAHGKALAREIAAYLRGGTFPSRVVLGSKWVEGKTF